MLGGTPLLRLRERNPSPALKFDMLWTNSTRFLPNDGETPQRVQHSRQFEATVSYKGNRSFRTLNLWRRLQLLQSHYKLVRATRCERPRVAGLLLVISKRINFLKISLLTWTISQTCLYGLGATDWRDGWLIFFYYFSKNSLNTFAGRSIYLRSVNPFLCKNELLVAMSLQSVAPRLPCKLRARA